jgi:putative Holliday junction resolvase
VTILALDFGTRRVGLAISHGVVAAPLQSITYDRSNRQAFFDELKEIVLDQKAEKIIVGLSLRDGEPTKQSEISRQIGEEISEKLDISVDFVDESFTSVEAKENDAKDIDSESAKIILERFLPR